MWPFRKQIKSRKTSKAIAYLKAAVPEDDDQPAMELPQADMPVLRDLNRDLMIAYVVDIGDGLEYVQYRDLHDEGVTEDQLHEMSLQNLTTRAANHSLRVAPHGNIFAVFLDGNFEASTILLDQLWEHGFRQFVNGEFLIAIPNRDILAFCERSSADGRKELLEVIARLDGSGDHPLTQHLYVRKDGRWHRDSEN